MNPRKPGRIFWVLTFAVGVISPGTGKRRINRRMQELHKGIESRDRTIRSLKQLNSDMASGNLSLRRELYASVGKNNTFLAQDEMNDALIQRDTSWTDATMPLTVVN